MTATHRVRRRPGEHLPPAPPNLTITEPERRMCSQCGQQVRDNHELSDHYKEIHAA